MKRLIQRLSRLLSRSPNRRDGGVEGEIQQELDFHIEMRTRENIASGMEPEEARRQALLRFGGVDQVRRQGRRILRRRRRIGSVGRSIDGARDDLRLAFRSMRASPATTTIAILVLTIGIGSATAVFSVVDGLLLDAFPYAERDRLVSLMGPSISGPTWPAFQGRLATLEGLTFYGFGGHELVGPEGAREARSVKVDASFLPLLGVEAAAGRGFGPDDFAANAPDVVMVSDRLSREVLLAEGGGVGSTLRIDGRPWTVIGVLPAGYTVVNYTTDLLMPLRDDDPGEAIGLLRTGVTFEEGRAEAEGLAAGLDLDLRPGGAPLTYRSLYEITVGGERPGLLLLAGAVALVMLIACANVANLLLVRSLDRGAELSLRAALGATRGRLFRQLTIENGLLAMFGGGSGCLAAVWLMPALLALNPSLAENGKIAIDSRVLGFALILSLATTVLFGLVPAAMTRDANLRAGIKGAAGQASSSRGARRLLGTLVVAEIALSLVLLIGTGLLLRTFVALYPASPGFETDGRLTFGIRLQERRYPDAASRIQFYQRVLAELEDLPGVEASTLTQDLPLIGAVSSVSATPEEWDAARADPPRVWLETVSANYHDLMGVAIVRGRDLAAMPTGPPEIVLSEEARRALWPESEPLGKRVTLSSSAGEQDFVVVGVAADTLRLLRPDRQYPLAWVRFEDRPGSRFRGMSFIVRTSLPPEQLAQPVRELIARLDPELPVLDLRSMERIVYELMDDERFAMSLIGGFGGVAILLAGIGFYGVMAYAVAQRTRELGVRVALGASATNLRWMVVRRGVAITAVGVGLGLAGSVALSRVIESILFGVSATDPATYGLVVAVVVVVGMSACYIPARRATRVDPIIALRAE